VTEPTELLLKLALCLIAAVGLYVTSRRERSERPRGDQRLGDGSRGARAGILLTLLGGAGLAAALTNFLTFHSGQVFHPQEMFHYALGSKYFPELGYDGLYEASLAAQAQASPELPLPGTVRDLRTNAVVPATDVLGRRVEAIARFSPSRWKAFVATHAGPEVRGRQTK